MPIEVRCSSETATSKEPAKMQVLEDGRVVSEVIATIVQEKGADGGMYNVVKLSRVV